MEYTPTQIKYIKQILKENGFSEMSTHEFQGVILDEYKYYPLTHLINELKLFKKNICS
jgi:hypothetical protein